ncbi:MAG: DHA2 family efflux MFS transporter permease subunit [Desulfobulbaceae bacterium]|nr:DHA2 family efflux MFS transporter permease subunit [Desulfobulbaceae bacterium]
MVYLISSEQRAILDDLIAALQLANAAKQFRQGKMDARSDYVSKNEFGTLTTAFNLMAETVQTQLHISDQAARMSGILAFRQIQNLTAQLEQQNSELEIQRQKIATQANDLSHQNSELEMQKQQMKTESSPQSSDVDYSRKWHTMAAVGTGVFLATVDGSIINVSLPTLVRSLNTEFAVVQWVVLSYLLTITCTMAGIGRLGDMVGKKSIYVLGFVVFTLGSVLCGLSPTVNWLVTFRILQAIGAAMTMALGAAIITEAFPLAERGKAMGIIGTIVSAGIVTGPALGGLILGVLSWRWIFFINLPIGILGTILALRFLPDFKPKGGQQFDIQGAFTLCSSLLSLLLGLTFGQQQGFSHPLVYVLTSFGIMLLAVFVFIEHKVKQPMIDPQLFTNRIFSVNLTTGIISFIALGGTVILLPFYLENILEFSPMKVGLLMGIIPLMLGITSPFSGTLSDLISSRKITMVGLVVMLIGYLSASTLSQETTALSYGIRIFAIGAGIGIFMSPNNSAIMGAAPRHQLGIVSGMMAQSRTLGQTIGVAVIGAIWAGRTLLYAGEIDRESATLAPVQAQISGMQDAFFTAAALVALALLLNFRAYLQETSESSDI